MPLSTSPFDGAPMRQIQRYGIEFDVRRTTGGVWPDKGELDKLITLVRKETLSKQSRHSRRGRHRDDDDYRHSRHNGGRRSRLTDLFIF